MPGYMGYTASHNKDGSVTFGYTPVLPGTYKITVQYNGEIPEGGELSCLIEEAEGGFITAYGLGNMIDSDTVHAGAEVTVHRPEPPSPDAEDDLQSPTIAQEQDDQKEMQETGIDISPVVGFNTQEGPAISMEDQESALLSITGQDQGEGAMEIPDDDHDLAGFDDAGDNASQAQVIGGDVTKIKQELLEVKTSNKSRQRNADVIVRVFSMSPSDNAILNAFFPNAEGRPVGILQQAINKCLRDSKMVGPHPAQAIKPAKMLMPPELVESSVIERHMTSKKPSQFEVKKESTLSKTYTCKEAAAKKTSTNINHEPHKQQSVLGGEVFHRCLHPECDKKLRCWSSYEAHLLRYHGFDIGRLVRKINRSLLRDNVIQCGLCPVICQNDTDLIMHIDLMHLAEKLFPCDVCLEVMTLKSSLNHNVTETHKNKVQTSENFAVESLENDHPSDLIDHDESLDDDESYDQLKPIKPDPASVAGNIDDPPKTFADLEVQSTDVGNLSVSSQLFEPNQEQSPITNITMLFICDESDCEKTFSSENALKKHQISHKGLKYTCTNHECKEKFSLKHNYLAHLRCTHGFTPKQAVNIMNDDRKASQKQSLESGDEEEISKDDHPLTCEKCSKTFSSKSNLNNHMALIHSVGKERPVCDICGKVCPNKAKLGRHMLVHSKKRSFRCEQCPKTFKTSQSLNSHMCLHGTGRTQCEICNKCFPSQSKLKRHLPTHRVTNTATGEIIENTSRRRGEGKDIYLCAEPGCMQQFRTKGMLCTHINKEHDSKKSSLGTVSAFDCTTCGKLFNIQFKLDRHSTKHSSVRSFMCEICGNALKSNDCLNTHLREIHGINPKESSADSMNALPPFLCPHCGKSFKRKFRLNQHIQAHKSTEKIPCEQCDKTFPTMYKMKEHIRTVHPVVDHHVICPVEGCNKVMKSKCYNTHKKIHENLRWGCTDVTCSRHFSTKNSMLRHVEYFHCTAEATISCEVDGCAKLFKTKANLQQHMRSHVKERSFTCEVCAKSFKTRNTLVLHSKIHFTESQIPCVHCGKRFTRRNRLREHLLKHESGNWSNQ